MKTTPIDHTFNQISDFYIKRTRKS